MPKALNVYEVLRRPVVTEKSTALAAEGKYDFEVALRSNKPQIRAAVQEAFDVNVVAVNTMMARGRRARNRYGNRTGKAERWKKAIVTLAPGDQIEFFEGV